MLRQDDWIKGQLVTEGWRFGRVYGGHVASCMVMSCLANRVKAGWGTWVEVLDRIPNFAAVTEMPVGRPAIWEPEFIRLLHEVEAIYDQSRDWSNGGLYWADLREIHTLFFKEKILGNMATHPRVMDQGSFVCFR